MQKLAEQSLKEVLLFFSSFDTNEDGSISREFGSEAYKKAATKMQKYMQSCGMKSYIDGVGNVHGIYKSPQATKKEILIGSHLDTVKEGGRFDGLLGILAGIECVKRLKKEEKILNCDLHIVATNGEEGNELGGTFGSRCLVGKFDVENKENLEKMQKFGFSKEDILKSKMDFSQIACYLELHIEQGKTLEETGDEMGIVTGIVGLQRYEITVKGENNHAGTTMMEYRKDALVKSAQIINYADQLARQLGNHLVATFSKVSIHPNTIAVINQKVNMVLEFRNQNEELMEKFISLVKAKFENDDLFEIKFFTRVKKKPVNCSANLIEAMEKANKNCNTKFRFMPSGATHDGNMLALQVPIGMLFIPSKAGISHNKEEFSEWSQCETGVNVLYQTILELTEV